MKDYKGVAAEIVQEFSDSYGQMDSGAKADLASAIRKALEKVEKQITNPTPCVTDDGHQWVCDFCGARTVQEGEE